MHLKRKLPWILTGKALLATGSIAMVALALVTYTATITINFNTFFLQGSNAMTWSATTASGTRYFPDGTDATGVTSPNSTIATPVTTTSADFVFVTQGTGAGYVQVTVQTAAPSSDFQTFSMFVLFYSGSTNKWVNETIYTTSALTITEPSFNGLSTSSVAFVKVLGGSTIFYLIQVNYVLVGTPTGSPTSVVLGETPSLN